MPQDNIVPKIIFAPLTVATQKAALAVKEDKSSIKKAAYLSVKVAGNV